ncbi:MAG: UDP-N-acetylmuramoyl-tripeptide--D-alanyl-D-alanine ligase [Burkholderiales bacterium]|nr:UDP-N-acetylmuramoyl-tripeptide--D-alanyl-D-alanine ligase [Burkholderiales bacterium]
MMNLREAAAAMAGCLYGEDRPFHGASTDTRSLAAGELFFAIKGERFDAIRFLDQAFAAGAAGAVVQGDNAPEVSAPASLIRVDDTRAALGRLAAYWRGRFRLPLIAITGSNGKTTVKDMLATVLRAGGAGDSEVLATEGNLNNDIGMPLTLLRLRASHRYAVIEMGMNHAGEIRYLTGLAQPSVALITNAGSAHIGLLGSPDAIARAKGEIYEGLDEDGIALVNADDIFADLWRSQNAHRRTLEFALEHRAQITGRYAGHALHSDIVIDTPRGSCELRLNAPGEHNVRNAIAAAAAAYALGVPPAAVCAGLAAFRAPPGRLQCCAGRNGAVVIDDSYNANPESALAAIAVLAAMPGRRVLVLGDMGELGADRDSGHVRVGEAARAASIERLFTLGAASALAAGAFGPSARHFTRIEELIAAVEPELDADTTVLVKGSRFMQMERVVQSLRAGAA